MKLKVKGFAYQTKDCEINGKTLSLYPHQIETLNIYQQKKNILLTTPTGSGKTLSALLPLLLKESVNGIFVYPTNELIRNQAKAIKLLLYDFFHLEANIIPEFLDNNKITKQAPIDIIVIDSETLKYETNFNKPKGLALQRLLSATLKKHTIILTNPDTLFILFNLIYAKSSGTITNLPQFKYLVIDEFHIYQGTTLAKLYYMLIYAKQLQLFPRKSILTATPDKELEKQLKKSFNLEKVKDSKMIAIKGKFSVVNDLEVIFRYSSGFDNVDDISDLVINEIWPIIRKLESTGNFVPCVIILNSVIKARALEDKLLENDEIRKNKALAPITGLMDKARRTINRQIIIGTSSIEIGIDFDSKFLIMEANNSATFLQRFGRAGRKNPGIVYVYANFYLIEKLKEEFLNNLEYKKEVKIKRKDFISAIRKCYPATSQNFWFIKSPYGVAYLKLFFETLLEKITFSNKKILLNKLNKALKEKYIEFKISEKEVTTATQELEYLNYSNNSFRGTLSSLKVIDKKYQYRYNAGNYTVNIDFLLNRGTLFYNKRKNEIIIKDYKWKQVEFSDISESINRNYYELENYFPDELMLIRDKKLEKQFEELLDGQIICVIPKSNMENFNWQIRLFPWRGEKKEGLICFGDNAIFVRAWKRERENGRI